MNRRYVVFDVETPNSKNDRMSAIGITVVEKGQIKERYASFINPETHFEPFHVALTGISPELVSGKPTFPALWPKIAPLLDSGLLVAHNAPFDLSVLAKCLHAYGIHWHSIVPYACTCQMSRRLLPQLPNHKLNTLCQFLGVDLNHHHADSDSLACGEILLHHLRSGAAMSSFIRMYDLQHICTIKSRPK